MTGRSHLFSKVLALTSVLLLTALLLPFAQGASKCKATTSTGDVDCFTDQLVCVKKWHKNGRETPFGCSSTETFLAENGFEVSKKCGPVVNHAEEKLDYPYACSCFANDDPCNGDDLGDEDYKKWKAEDDKTTKAPAGKGLALSPLLPLTLAALTLGALLAC